jgi:recombination protein RecR
VRTSPPIERLVRALKRLPGIGEKSATRLAFHMLGARSDQVQELADAIARLKHEIVLCESCFDLTDRSPCEICRDPRRDPSLLCSPIDGVGPDELRVAELEQRVRAGGIEEIVLATNPNAEGDATAHYLCERLRESGVRLTRIAYGMPLGGDLEYADHVTVGICIENRRAI